MTKSTITREQAQKIIVAADEVITALAGTNEDVHPDDSKKMCELWDDLNDRYAPPVVVRELARMALAAMDSEPVAWTWHYREQWHVTNDERRAEFVAKDGDVAVLPLYRHAQPAQISEPVLPLQDKDLQGVIDALEHPAGINAAGKQVVRLALVEIQERRKADNEPVAWTDEEELRDVNVAGIGYLFGIDREANKFADPRRQIMLYRHAQPAPEKYNIGDATMRHIFTPTGMTNVSDMQAVFDRVEAVLVGMEQPEPVVPDGYVMVPKEPTKEMIDAGWLHYMATKNPSSKGTYKAMLAAAPQEVPDGK